MIGPESQGRGWRQLWGARILYVAAVVVTGPLALTSACHRRPVVPPVGARDTVIVRGSVAYRQRIALPAGAVITVTVEDVSLADAPARTMGEQITTTTGQQVPIPFEVRVPSSNIDPRHQYAVRARIEVEGNLRFVSTTRYSVLTNGAPNSQALMLDAVTTPSP